MLLRRADSRHSNAGLDGAVNFDHDIASLSASPAVAALLQQLCDLTGMGFAAVARVTEDRWVACHVLDKIEFGLEPGAELKIKTTICDEIRSSGEEVYCPGRSPIRSNTSAWPYFGAAISCRVRQSAPVTAPRPGRRRCGRAPG